MSIIPCEKKIIRSHSFDKQKHYWGMNSHCHPMYGSVGKWFYTHIAGITPLSAGFEKIQIRPYIPKKLLSAEATVETVRGDVTVKWKKAYGKINLLVDIPNGSCANVFFGKNEYSVTSGTHVYTIDEDDN